MNISLNDNIKLPLLGANKKSAIEGDFTGCGMVNRVTLTPIVFVC
jgi:hypothetical protein